jgi:hypothetical protein
MTSQGSDKSELLERLYPVPLSTGVVGLPGPTAASTQALLTALLHNREKNHIFFNDKGFHKYVAFGDVRDLVPWSHKILLFQLKSRHAPYSSHLRSRCITGHHSGCLQEPRLPQACI